MKIAPQRFAEFYSTLDSRLDSKLEQAPQLPGSPALATLAVAASAKSVAAKVKTSLRAIDVLDIEISPSE